MLYARFEVLKNIEKKLGNKHLNRFRASPLGNFLDHKITKSPFQLLYHIIRRQCSLTKEDELWFNFEERIVQFRLRDFEKITGLNCGSLPTLDMDKLSSRFITKYFDLKNL